MVLTARCFSVLVLVWSALSEPCCSCYIYLLALIILSRIVSVCLSFPCPSNARCVVQPLPLVVTPPFSKMPSRWMSGWLVLHRQGQTHNVSRMIHMDRPILSCHSRVFDSCLCKVCWSLTAAQTVTSASFPPDCIDQQCLSKSSH